MLFSKVKGQKELTKKIMSLVDGGHLPHAVLFDGKDGYGNLAIALSTAQYISCTNRRNDEDACGECSSCKKYTKMMHPDLHFVFPNTTTSTVKKDNESQLFISKFREFIMTWGAYNSLENWYDFLGSEKKQGVINVRDAQYIVNSLSIKTYESPYRIMVVWNIDKMNEEASNRILKILEEPYPNTVFLFTTENKNAILPTILSRVQQIKVPPIDDDTLYKIIKAENQHLSDEEIKLKISLCEGDIIRLKSLDTDKENERMRIFVEMNRLAMGYKRYAKNISDFIDEISTMKREELKSFLNFFLSTVEKCYLYGNGVEGKSNPLVNTDEKFRNNYIKFITVNNLDDIYNVIQKAQDNINHNANAKINLFDMIIKLGYCLEKR